jgi:hypothetical protein
MNCTIQFIPEAAEDYKSLDAVPHGLAKIYFLHQLDIKKEK